MSNCSPSSSSCFPRRCRHAEGEQAQARASTVVGFRQSQRDMETGGCTPTTARPQLERPHIVGALTRPSIARTTLPTEPPPSYDSVVAARPAPAANNLITVNLGSDITMHFPVGTPADVIAAAVNAVKGESATPATSASSPARQTATTTQAPFPPTNKTTAASKYWLKSFLTNLTRNTEMTWTRGVASDPQRQTRFTMLLSSAMNTNLSKLSLHTSKTLFNAMKSNHYFKASGYHVNLVLVGNNGVSRIVSDSEISTIVPKSYRRSYLALYLRHDDEPLILDVCTNCFLKHNELMLGTWKEVEDTVYQHLLNKDIPSPYPPTEQGAIVLCDGALKTGDRVFPSSPEAAVRLNTYLASGRGNAKDLAGKITRQCYGTQICFFE